MPHPVLPVSASSTWEDVSIPTRQGVRQRVLLTKAANAGTKAVILFAGGNGTPITIPEGQGIRFSGNFLVRSSAFFANDGGIHYGHRRCALGQTRRAFRRQRRRHGRCFQAIVDAPHGHTRGGGFSGEKRARARCYLIGTSRGTLSVAYLATVMTDPNVKGYVLTASLAESPPAIRSYAPRITDPVLMVHHTGDVCRVTMYSRRAGHIYETIPASPHNAIHLRERRESADRHESLSGEEPRTGSWARSVRAVAAHRRSG